MPAWLHDPLLVVASLLFVLLLLFLARRLDSRAILSGRALRSALHVSVGVWTFAATILFREQTWALVPPALFFGVNASPRVAVWFPQIAADASERRGLWTFPLGVALLYVACWSVDQREAMLAGVAALGFADPLAAAAGRRYGQRRLRGGHGRTLEGSVAFFLATALMSAALASGQDAVVMWRAAVLCGATGAIVEALSPSGWDNAVIPVAVGMAYRAAL